MQLLVIERLQRCLHEHFDFTTAQIVINCTLKCALAESSFFFATEVSKKLINGYCYVVVPRSLNLYSHELYRAHGCIDRMFYTSRHLMYLSIKNNKYLYRVQNNFCMNSVSEGLYYKFNQFIQSVFIVTSSVSHVHNVLGVLLEICSPP